jgi:hypothetical protein
MVEVKRFCFIYCTCTKHNHTICIAYSEALKYHLGLGNIFLTILTSRRALAST